MINDISHQFTEFLPSIEIKLKTLWNLNNLNCVIPLQVPSLHFSYRHRFERRWWISVSNLILLEPILRTRMNPFFLNFMKKVLHMEEELEKSFVFSVHGHFWPSLGIFDYSWKFPSVRKALNFFLDKFFIKKVFLENSCQRSQYIFSQNLSFFSVNRSIILRNIEIYFDSLFQKKHLPSPKAFNWKKILRKNFSQEGQKSFSDMVSRKCLKMVQRTFLQVILSTDAEVWEECLVFVESFKPKKVKDLEIPFFKIIFVRKTNPQFFRSSLLSRYEWFDLLARNQHFTESLEF